MTLNDALNNETRNTSDIMAYKAEETNTFSKVYDEELSEVLDFRVLMDFNNALKRGDLYLVFQPIISKNSNDHYFEVLVRWNHLTKGYLSPRDFIQMI